MALRLAFYRAAVCLISAPETIAAVARVHVRFRFEGELKDFLTPQKQRTEFEHVTGATDTLKHVIESLGVPRTEVGHVTVNGRAGALSDPVADGAAIQVFPLPTPVLQNTTPRFVLDGHLGRLAAYLRMLGFDTRYERLAGDEFLAAVSSNEQRLLLTRDVGLLKRREVQQGYCVRSDKPHDQLREVSTRFALRSYFAPFTRYMECNAPLHAVPKSEVADLLPPHTRETKNEFSRCCHCRRIFWRGSHHARMVGWVESLTAGLGSRNLS